MRITSCPLCSSRLLRHARRGEVYWLCTSCRQEFSSRFVDHLTSCLSSLVKALPHLSDSQELVLLERLVV